MFLFHRLLNLTTPPGSTTVCCQLLSFGEAFLWKNYGGICHMSDDSRVRMSEQVAGKPQDPTIRPATVLQDRCLGRIFLPEGSSRALFPASPQERRAGQQQIESTPRPEPSRLATPTHRRPPGHGNPHISGSHPEGGRYGRILKNLPCKARKEALARH